MGVTQQRGFSLIELMVVIAILGIIAAVAWPAYESEQNRNRRTDAVSALTKAANVMESCYSDNGGYGTACLPPSMKTSSNKYYTITLAVTSSDAYTLTATAQNAQLGDTKCRTMSLDYLGQKTSKNSGGNPSTGCWPS